jgi:hypothetical protein
MVNRSRNRRWPWNVLGAVRRVSGLGLLLVGVGLPLAAADYSSVNGGVLLTWSTNFTGYDLQTTSSVADLAGWANLTTNYSLFATNSLWPDWGSSTG